jgi:hypothetical protein
MLQISVQLDDMIFSPYYEEGICCKYLMNERFLFFFDMMICKMLQVFAPSNVVFFWMCTGLNRCEVCLCFIRGEVIILCLIYIEHWKNDAISVSSKELLHFHLHPYYARYIKYGAKVMVQNSVQLIFC